MTICPIALAVGCRKCPIFAVCPVKGVIGDYGRKTTRRPRRPPLPGPSRDRSARRRAADRPRANEAMTYAAITGWGKCMPPSILTNADLASLMETDDEWITSRTGIKERRVSHVTGIELSHVAAARALACAGLAAGDVELIVYGSCSNDETVPNSSSGVQLQTRLVARRPRWTSTRPARASCTVCRRPRR